MQGRKRREVESTSFLTSVPPAHWAVSWQPPPKGLEVQNWPFWQEKSGFKLVKVEDWQAVKSSKSDSWGSQVDWAVS